MSCVPDPGKKATRISVSRRSSARIAWNDDCTEQKKKKSPGIVFFMPAAESASVSYA
jgi:hypothetical protein